MGCCYSCKEDNNSQSGDVNERTHLLVDPVSNINVIQRVHSDDFIAQYPNSLPKKSDEQSALNRILQETATNVIDVAALDSHNLEQHEYLERMRQYTQRLGAMGANVNTRWSGNSTAGVAGGSGTLLAPSTMGGPSTSPSGRMHLCLLTDIPAPEKVLAEDHPNPEDLILVMVLMGIYVIKAVYHCTLMNKDNGRLHPLNIVAHQHLQRSGNVRELH